MAQIQKIAPTPTARPFWLNARKAERLDLLARAGVVTAFASMRRMSVEHARAVIAQSDPRYNEQATQIVCRAVTSPASTMDAEWATELVVAVGMDLHEALMPRSAFGQLAAQGMQVTFGRAEVLVPNFTPIGVGGFVRQGETIPVVQGMTTGQILTRKKLACIVTYSGELTEDALIPLEGILRTRIPEAMSVVLDEVLLDDQPGTDIRPAGLRNGGTVVASTGNIKRDVQLLAEALFAAAGNYIRRPVLIVHTAQALATRVESSRDAVPVIASAGMEPGTVAMVDAADFACAGGEIPHFEISKDAALHFEDAPQHIVDSAAVASPVRSLWQEELIGLKVVFDVDWCLRRPGVAAVMTSVHWT